MMSHSIPEMLRVSPTKLEFFVDDRKSHNTVLKVSNPTTNLLRYKLTCTASDNYMVENGEGQVKSGGCIFIRIHHLKVAMFKKNQKNEDCFRMEVYKGTTRIGKPTTIVAELLYSKDTQPREQLPFQLLPGSTKTQADPASSTASNEPIQVDTPKRPSLLYVYIGIVCLAVLYLPIDGETPSFLSNYIKLENSHKLIAAYVLGMITVVLFRQ
ncbi:motile sperm domain-containing protein 1-like isoform X2 [Watersipora subatra]|uniref:motile sperm domain-containing protein 1-like isoform X2 n=1 Tax=Watersipora subatra TaxID=2589382 RepID=UPI00355BE6C4